MAEEDQPPDMESLSAELVKVRKEVSALRAELNDLSRVAKTSYDYVHTCASAWAAVLELPAPRVPPTESDFKLYVKLIRLGLSADRVSHKTGTIVWNVVWTGTTIGIGAFLHWLLSAHGVSISTEGL